MIAKESLQLVKRSRPALRHSAFGTAPLPTSLLPCCVQTPFLRVWSDRWLPWPGLRFKDPPFCACAMVPTIAAATTVITKDDTSLHRAEFFWGGARAPFEPAAGRDALRSSAASSMVRTW
jgi:hypothetical protein